ncbi:MAG TPA: beta-ketoacyl-[acyl-carrier-protein] synthase II [Dehalococcoidia bacterium]|nr:beta-ketoacyl-[acyl-carrier-protein] synthase II [Dehalococcoidia bacterium]
MPNRVVVTGYGAVTPLGLNIEDTWRNLIAGVSGVDYISLFDTTDFKVKIAAEVRGFNATDYLDPATARRTDRFAQFAIAASLQAMENARLKINDSNRYDVGILIGSGVGGIDSLAQQLGVLNTRGPSRVSPYLIPMMIADSAPGQLSIITGIRGANFSMISACATGTDAIGMAYKIVKWGEIKVMVAGGTDAAVTPIGLAGFSQTGALSRNADPKRASRPFDAQRDGFVVGEGAAVLVLENLEYAKSRGANILAEIIGYGATSDAFHVTQPQEDGEAAARAIELALAGVDYSEVGYINAHGTSTPLNDASETRAIKRVFGSRAYDIPVSSTKSMVGHMMGAAGALEAIVCCKVVNEGIIPPTINLEHPDPECDLDYVPSVARSAEVRIAVSNSFGFCGHNAAITISRFCDS